MDEIPIGKVGQIVQGKECGRFVEVQNDRERTGGFLIFTSDHSDFAVAFDSWVEDSTGLNGYFEEARWHVKWLDERCRSGELGVPSTRRSS